MRQRLGAIIALILAAILAAAWLARDRGADPVEAIQVVIDRAAGTPPRSNSPGIGFPALSRGRFGAGASGPGDIAALAADAGCSGDRLNEIWQGRESEDERRHRLASLASTLAESGNTELVLAATMLSGFESPFDAIERMQHALELGPEHPLVLWHAAGLCIREQSGGFCTDPAVRLRAEHILGRNGAYWSRIAAGRLARGARRAALEALERAAIEPNYDTYWVEQVMLLERAMAAGPDTRYSLRIADAMIAVRGPATNASIAAACENSVGRDAVWLEACAAYGKRLASDANELIDRSMAHSILEAVQAQTGDEQLAREISVRRQEVEDLLAAVSNVDWAAMFLDDAIAAGYIDEFAARGEIAAMRYLTATGERLRADPDYDPCAAIESPAD